MNEKQFGTLSTKKIFFKVAIPSMLSMLFSSIYIIADGIFVGRYIGSNALAAVNLVMPIMMISFSIGDMIAIGSSVKISIALGEKNNEKASCLFSASLYMIWTLSVILIIFGTLFAKPIIFAVIKDNSLAELAFKYVRVFIFALPLVMPLFAVDNYLRACGKARFSMYLNICVSMLNLFLDWLFIAHFRLGIEYAALASVISMSLGSIIALCPFIAKKLTLHFTKPKVTLRDIGGIIYNGSSEFFNNISGSIMAILINAILLSLGGSIAVAVYGIVMYIDALLISILYGILDSVQPPVSYNVGAKKIKRTLEFFKISCITAATISIICMAVMMLFPETLASLFAKDGDLEIIHMTKIAIMLFAPSYLFTWFNMVTSSFLTSFDKPKESLIIMAFRSILFPLLCLLIMTHIIGVNGVFVTPTIAGGMTFVVAVIIWIKTQNKQKQLIKENK